MNLLQEWLASSVKLPKSLRQTAPLENGHASPTIDTNELKAILADQPDLGVCLLRDSPYRILRVSIDFVEQHVHLTVRCSNTF